MNRVLLACLFAVSSLQAADPVAIPKTALGFVTLNIEAMKKVPRMQPFVAAAAQAAPEAKRVFLPQVGFDISSMRRLTLVISDLNASDGWLAIATLHDPITELHIREVLGVRHPNGSSLPHSDWHEHAIESRLVWDNLNAAISVAQLGPISMVFGSTTRVQTHLQQLTPSQAASEAWAPKETHLHLHFNLREIPAEAFHKTPLLFPLAQAKTLDVTAQLGEKGELLGLIQFDHEDDAVLGRDMARLLVAMGRGQLMSLERRLLSELDRPANIQTSVETLASLACTRYFSELLASVRWSLVDQHLRMSCKAELDSPLLLSALLTVSRLPATHRLPAPTGGKLEGLSDKLEGPALTITPPAAGKK